MKDFFNQDLQLRDTVAFIFNGSFGLGSIMKIGEKTISVYGILDGVPELVDVKPSGCIKRVSEMKFERVSIQNDGDGQGYVIPRREKKEFLDDLRYADKHDDYAVFEEKYDQYSIKDLNEVKLYANFLGELKEID